MQKTVVINVVGLTKPLIEKMPFLSNWAKAKQIASIKPILPAVTCSMQTTYLTGKTPIEHGIVGNGWFFDDTQEVRFWQQSNKLVESPKIWDILKNKHKEFTVANHFWWYNMYSDVDFSVTPRPQYWADGQKIPDIYTEPASLRDELQSELGQFPLFNFWGPKTSIKSSKWIADASIFTDKKHNPTLSLIYLPHLDYNLQRFGIDFEKITTDLIEIDNEVKKLITYYESTNTNIVILSEYGITNVSNPIHLNRVLRKHNLLKIRLESGKELLDAGASEAFVVADHQFAHVYIKDKKNIENVKQILKSIEGVEQVFEKSISQLNHKRAGDLIVVADAKSWFTYYFWDDDKKAPDYARMVDIHKKPGYDPVEMYINPNIKIPIFKLGFKLLCKKLGFRTLFNVIPLDATLIKGSHGRIPESEADFPVYISSKNTNLKLEATAIFDLLIKEVEAN